MITWKKIMCRITNLIIFIVMISGFANAEEIDIYIKQFSGNTVQIKIDDNKEIWQLAIASFEKRNLQQEAATVYNYAKSINLMLQGSKLNYSRTLKDYGIQSGSTIYELPKAWTMAFELDFDFGTLSATCALTNDDIKEPFHINPGCNHCFEKSELNKWVQKCKESKAEPSCPICRSSIESMLLYELAQ
jgi:hypothetical protein